MGRVLLTVLLAGALVGGVAYYLDLIPSVPGPAGGIVAAAPADDRIKANLNEPLYAIVKLPPFQQKPLTKDRDPIVIAGQLNARQQVDIACPVEGRLAFVGEQVPEGATAVAGLAPFVAEPFEYVQINLGDREPTRLYRLLKEDQAVVHGQMVALVDPSKAIQEVVKAEAKLAVARAQLESAVSTEDEALVRFNRAANLFRSKAIGEEEYGLARLTHVKAKADTQEKKKAIEVAESERTSGLMLQNDHEIRNKLLSQRSIIKKIHRKGLESVKNGEPIVTLYSLDKLEAEAMVDAQFRLRMHEGMKVVIEPQREESPVRRLSGHRAEVTSVAVTKDFPDPLYVSGSEDRTVRVWDRKYEAELFTLLTQHGVRVVACSPPAAKHNVILVGCADGSLYLWDLGKRTDPEFATKPSRKNAAAHRDAVTALAFSPDGKYFATGGADNNIRIWETEGDFTKPLYTFDHEHGVSNPHQGAITSLHFTPQSRLVSAARDNTLRVWNLFKDGAKAHLEPITNRSGNVGQLGVSTDGRWMLFDHGKTLHVMSVEKGQVAARPIQNPAGGIPFETLAIASPDASLILTAGAAEGRLQLWKSPGPGQRAFEVRQLTAERSPVTSAAFSPYAGKSPDTSYAVSGAKDGSVYIWPLPTQDEVSRHPIEASLTRIGQSIDPTSRQIRIGIDLTNEFGPQFPGGNRLEPGRPVTIVIEP